MSASTLLTPGLDGDHEQTTLEWTAVVPNANTNTNAGGAATNPITAAAGDSSSSSSSAPAPSASSSVAAPAAAPSSQGTSTLHVSTQDAAPTPAVPGVSPGHGVSRIVRRNGTGPLTPHGGGGAGGSGAVGPVDSPSSCTEAASSMSDAEHEEFLAQHEVAYMRTVTCQAPRSMLWKALMNKIRHPELYTHAAGVTIVAEGIDFVFRELRVTSPAGPCGGEQVHVVREKVTWDEGNENVRFTLYEDPTKEGYIENQISLDASGAVCLTVSCHWHFVPHPDLTPKRLEMWRSKLRAALDAGCIKTVRVVEEQHLALLQERRRRHSVSQVAEQQAEVGRLMQQMAIKDKDKTAAAAGTAAPVAPAPAGAPSSSPPASATATSPATRTKHIAVAAKPAADN